jgi:histone H3/H4
MADLNAIQRHYRHSSPSLEIATVRSIAKTRSAQRPAVSGATTEAIQRHAEAVGRGEPSVSPITRARPSASGTR